MSKVDCIGALGTINRIRGVPPGWGQSGWDFDGGATENQRAALSDLLLECWMVCK